MTQNPTATVDAPAGATVAMGAPSSKEIVTLPPLAELHNQLPLSERTGEPRRPWLATVALVLFTLAGAFVAISYGIHWWLAADPESYARSARLIEWVKPEPGKWRSLAYEGLLAAVVALVGTACVVPGFQAWNGWRWSRWAGLVAVALAAGWTALSNWWAAPAVGLTLLGALLLFLPPMTRAFREFGQHRATGRPAYRRPERIFYGRLPRFR